MIYHYTSTCSFFGSFFTVIYFLFVLCHLFYWAKPAFKHCVSGNLAGCVDVVKSMPILMNIFNFFFSRK